MREMRICIVYLKVLSSIFTYSLLARFFFSFTHKIKLKVKQMPKTVLLILITNSVWLFTYNKSYN